MPVTHILRITVSILLLGALLAGIPPVQAARDIPDDNLAYPVLITLDSGASASGFYLNTHRYTYFVTAQHVLFNTVHRTLKSRNARLLSYPRNRSDDGRVLIHLDLKTLFEKGNLRLHDSQDAVLIRIAAISETGGRNLLEFMRGVKVLEAAPSGILAVDVSTVKTFNDVMVANEVFIFGYPTSLGIKEIPQIDYLKPLLRKGIVAGKNEVKKTIILDCPIYPGNSGGPVLEVDRVEPFRVSFRVIGMVTQFVPFAEKWVSQPHGYSNLSISNSGYSIVIPMDVVFELLEDDMAE